MTVFRDPQSGDRNSKKPPLGADQRRLFRMDDPPTTMRPCVRRARLVKR
jgi:hypothetical protein